MGGFGEGVAAEPRKLIEHGHLDFYTLIAYLN